MITASVHLQIPDLKRLLKKVSSAHGTAPAMRLIGAAGVDLARAAFREQRSPSGEKWPDLAHSTLAARRRRGVKGERPLHRTGALRNSFNYQLREGGRAVSIGTPHEFFKYHQQPTGPGKGIIPRRAALPQQNRPLPAAWQDEIVETLEAFLTKGAP